MYVRPHTWEDYSLKNIIIKTEIDDKTLDQIEEYLIQSDVGLEAAEEIKTIISQEKIDPKKNTIEEVNLILRDYIINLMKPLENESFFDKKDRLNAVLVSGVNGVGKTTTIGKLAKRCQSDNLSVMLAAGDTFRAAAVEQLQVWGERNDIPVISQGSGADSASVIFDAYQSAKSKKVDVLIADTAGRLHTKDNLMSELEKIVRVLKKQDSGLPSEILLVLDATTGQNALNQALSFNAVTPLTGLALTLSLIHI